MIEFYSGTPRSGKSYHAAERIYYSLRTGHNVIGNFAFDTTGFPHKHDFTMVSNAELKKYGPAPLVQFAKAHHHRGHEGETLLVIDEAGRLFGSREWQDAKRGEWLTFFSEHGKLGFDVIMIAQADIMVDKQVRQMFEEEVKHRRFRSLGWVGFLISPFASFIAIRYWYGNAQRLGATYLRFRKKIYSRYDSYALFEAATIGGSNGK